MGSAGTWKMSRTHLTAKRDVHKLAHWFHHLMHQMIPEERDMLKHLSFVCYKAQSDQQSFQGKTASFKAVAQKMESPFSPKKLHGLISAADFQNEKQHLCDGQVFIPITTKSYEVIEAIIST